jgi:hypothetical protein
MIGILAKKVRFLFELNTLYPYILHRLRVKVRTLCKRPADFMGVVRVNFHAYAVGFGQAAKTGAALRGEGPNQG